MYYYIIVDVNDMHVVKIAYTKRRLCVLVNGGKVICFEYNWVYIKTVCSIHPGSRRGNAHVNVIIKPQEWRPRNTLVRILIDSNLLIGLVGRHSLEAVRNENKWRDSFCAKQKFRRQKAYYQYSGRSAEFQK